jgi:DNA-binding MarR family transcriptional regulator
VVGLHRPVIRRMLRCVERGALRLSLELELQDANSALPIRDRILTSRIYRLVVTIKRSRTLACRRLFGLTGFDWNLVTRVGEVEPVALTELSSWLGIDKSQASRAVSRLTKAGLLRRRAARGEIGVSASGRRLFERGRRLVRSRNNALLGGASKLELANFTRAFEKLSANAHAMLDKELALHVGEAKPSAILGSRFLASSNGAPLPSPTLIALYNVIRRSGDYAYERALGLSDFDWRVLSRAGASRTLPLAHLIADLDRDKSQVGRSVKRLAARGLLKLTKIGPGRNVGLVLTDNGQQAYERLEQIALDRHEALTANLSERELRLLSTLLDKFSVNAAALLAAEQSRAGTAGNTVNKGGGT